MSDEPEEYVYKPWSTVVTESKYATQRGFVHMRRTIDEGDLLSWYDEYTKHKAEQEEILRAQARRQVECADCGKLGVPDNDYLCLLCRGLVDERDREAAVQARITYDLERMRQEAMSEGYRQACMNTKL